MAPIARDITGEGQSRRTFVKTAAYVAPAVLTLKAAPAFASYGSGAPKTSSNTESRKVPGPPPHAKAHGLSKAKAKANDKGARK